MNKELTGTNIELTNAGERQLSSFQMEGKSEQENVSVASTNICPPTSDDRWVFSSGAYLDSEGFINLPELSSKAYITIPWDKRSNKMMLIYTVVSGGNALVNTAYLDENRAQLSGNGSALMDKPDGYIQQSYFGGENIYGDALALAKYVVITFQRSAQYTPNPYVFKDVSVSIDDNAFVEYKPVTPAPEDPSEIKSVGYENSFDGIFEQGTFNYNNGANASNEKIIRTNIFKILPNTTYTFSINEIIGEFAATFFSGETSEKFLFPVSYHKRAHFSILFSALSLISAPFPPFPLTSTKKQCILY